MHVRLECPAIADDSRGAEWDVNPCRPQSGLLDGEMQQVVSTELVNGEVVSCSSDAVVAVGDEADRVGGYTTRDAVGQVAESGLEGREIVMSLEEGGEGSLQNGVHHVKGGVGEENW